MRKTAAFLIVASILVSGPAVGKDKEAGKRQAPASFKDLVACRQIADNAARLACYDSQVASLEQAESKGEVVVADRKQVEDAQRGLFGYSIPKSNLLGDSKGAQIDKIEVTVASARQYDYGRWRMTMDDGSVWDQIGTEVLAFDPRTGDKVTIKRASFGSYAAKVGGQPSIKVRRVQ